MIAIIYSGTISNDLLHEVSNDISNSRAEFAEMVIDNIREAVDEGIFNFGDIITDQSQFVSNNKSLITVFINIQKPE